MDSRKLTANFSSSLEQNVFRILNAGQLFYERVNIQAVIEIGRHSFVAIEKRQEGELIVRHIEVSFKQGIVIDEPTFDEVFLHDPYFAIAYKAFTKESGVVLVAQQDQMTSVGDTPCLTGPDPWTNVEWSHSSEHLIVSNNRELWHWTPTSGRFSILLSLEIPGYVSDCGAAISWSPDDCLMACTSSIMTGEISRSRGMRWDDYARKRHRNSVVDLAFIDVEQRRFLSRFQFRNVGILRWNRTSDRVHIRVRDESHGDPYVCYVIDPRTGDREQGEFPAD